MEGVRSVTDDLPDFLPGEDNAVDAEFTPDALRENNLANRV
jgi:hypothetical protein